MKLNQYQPLRETQAFYAQELLRFKTVSTKKAYLTRAIKQHTEWLNDVTEAVNRVKGQDWGWLHGEMFTIRHVEHYTKELSIITDMRKSIA